MSTVDLRKRLIAKIESMDNGPLLEEVYRLLLLETQDIEVYKLSDDQKNAIAESREQFKNGQVISNDQLDREMDEWLGK